MRRTYIFLGGEGGVGKSLFGILEGDDFRRWVTPPESPTGDWVRVGPPPMSGMGFLMGSGGGP